MHPPLASRPSLRAPAFAHHLLAVLLLAIGLCLPSGTHADDGVSLSLEEELAPIARERLFRDSTVGWQVVEVATGQEVFARDSDRRLNPASTMKVLTAAAALRHLGPAYRFTTELRTTGSIDASGALAGDLYVVGHGDPTLVVERLWKLLVDLKLEGIERIEGDVIFDESFLDTDYALPGWTKKEDLDRGPSYFPPISALSLNFNTVAIVIGPGPEVGAPARVRLETPAGGYVTLDNQVLTGTSRSRRWTGLKREEVPEGLKFTVTGSIPSSAGVKKYYRAVVDPTAHFMAAWEEMEEQVGIEVRGRHRRGVQPQGTTLLLQHRSPPLAAILMDMNKYSNNFMAEQVLRTLGAEVHGTPGTTAKGLQVVSSYLQDLGFEPTEYALVNGSGLSRDIWLQPRHLTAVLVDMARDVQVGHEFRSSLAIAGRDGTLWRRLRDQPGRLRGKTGTIDGVHGLAGYVEGGDGRTYAFAFVVNDLRGGSSRVKKLHDQFARELFALEVADAVDEGSR